jgi:hypothetical protein
MAMNDIDIFGFDFGQNKSKASTDDAAISFANPDNPDGALVIDNGTNNDGAAYGGGRALAQMSFQAEYRGEQELISLYRKIAQEPDIENAIDDIVNDAIVMDSEEDTVSLDLDDVDGMSSAIQEKIKDSFKRVLKLMKFRDRGDEFFREWYIDGRQYFHMVVDTKRPTDGIFELRKIDPRYIQLVREIHRQTNGQIEVVKGFREYYLYADPRMGQFNQALEISPEAICYISSGLIDAEYRSKVSNNPDYTKEIVISHLHKAIKPYNRLNQLEDALVIYRISRAPERLVFYVDVGNLNKSRGEAFMQENINKYKNKMVYDGKTGKVKNDRHIMSVMENVWLPRKQGSKGTEVSSLSGAMNLGQIDDVAYFKRKLLESLKTPTSRLEDDGGMMGARTSEISRDELKFTKFTNKLRKQYTKAFLIFLKTELILTRVCTLEDWEKWRDDIKFIWANDSYFAELKEQEILGARLDVLQSAGIENPVGKYFSHDWVRKTVLRQTSDEIDQQDKLIKEEANNEQFNPPSEEDGGDGFGGTSGGFTGDDNKGDNTDQEDVKSVLDEPKSSPKPNDKQDNAK